MEFTIEEIEKLAQIIEKYGLTDLEVCQGEFGIKLKKEIQIVQGTYINQGLNGKGRTIDYKHITDVKALQDELASTKESLLEKDKNTSDSKVQINEETTNDGEVFIKTPIAGIFYRQSSPEKPPYVVSGQHVKKGETICLVEAMKMINEITASCDGVIKEFLVENEEFVEFDQSLVVIIKD